MWITRAISITNFAVASSALGFQVFVLYPWHKELDESFKDLKQEHLRVLQAVKDVVKEVDPEGRKGGFQYSILKQLGMGTRSVFLLPKPASPVFENAPNPANAEHPKPQDHAPEDVLNPTTTSLGISQIARYAFAGAFCCSFTHAILTPVDVVKTRVQLEPAKYHRGLIAGMKQIVAADGTTTLLTGFGPTITGYFLQGAFKFGGYEYLKAKSNDIMGPEKAASHRNAVYLASSAAAEFIGDIFLCPFEAARIRLVSQPNFASGMVSAMKRMARYEGIAGLYSGFTPIVLKQVPYTMATFVVYEKATETAYNLIDKATASNTVQSGVNLGCGLVAGMAAALVSQPADTVLSKINKEKGQPGEGIMRRIVNIVRTLGFFGSYTGIGPRLVMVGGMTAVQFGIYGHIQRALGAGVGSETEQPEETTSIVVSVVSLAAASPQNI